MKTKAKQQHGLLRTTSSGITLFIEPSASHEGCWYWGITDHAGDLICDGEADQSYEDCVSQANGNWDLVIERHGR